MAAFAPDDGLDLLEEGGSLLKCVDLGDYRNRLQSFRTHWWFNKSLPVSPIECARRGWVNVSADTLHCNCCQKTLKITKENGKWLANGALVSPDLGEPSAAAWAELLVKSHGELCPWRGHEVSLDDPSKMSDRELACAVEERLKSLRKLTFVPVLEAGSKADEDVEASLVALARAGWEAVTAERLMCSVCMRIVEVKSFAHVRVDGAALEPAAKAARLAPAEGCWTPSAPRAAPVTAMDPYALHRFYCPLYVRGDDDLGPTAARIIKAHVEASKEETEGGGNGAAAALAESPAVARAEELLRELERICPPA